MIKPPEIKEYIDPNRTYSDTVQVLSEFPTLRVRTNVYTDEYGRPELLLCLYGMVPAYISNTAYRIPIEIWVPKQYPDRGPFGFVKPTESMMIHPGNYVDTNGKCYHPYLSYWNPSQQLVEFVRILSDVFSKEPPVYAKPPAYEPQPPPQSPVRSSRSSQVYLNQSPNSPASFASTSASPALPPKPPRIPIETQIPQYSTTTHSQVHTQQFSPPPQMHSQMSQKPHVQQMPEQSAPATTTIDIMDMEVPGSGQSSTPPNTNGSIPGPRRPPNPEKLQSLDHLRHALHSIIQNEVKVEQDTDQNALNHTTDTLKWVEDQLGFEKNELDRLGAACEENQRILAEKIEQAKRVTVEARSAPQPNIDDVVCAENVVYNQLYDLVAEDHAIEDTIYVLSKALDRDQIKLEPFMKHTRTLAREQFLKKALVVKISGHLGLQ